MVYCFFKDWNYLREYIQERWCDYQDRILSFAAVSVMTNTAFELLPRPRDELLSQIPVRSSLRDYQSMADMLFYNIALAHVDYHEKDVLYGDDKEAMDEAIHEEADWLCLARYWDQKNVPPKKMTT
jgi:hypothetical protein